MIFKDYYKILGFETNKVTVDEIKNAYRECAKKYHPDINVGNAQAETIFKDVNEAYRILSNDKLKRKYDFNWNKYIGSRKKKKSAPKEKKNFKEMLLDILFGGVHKKSKIKRTVPEYGENIDTEIDISIREAFFGISKQIKLRSVNGKETTFTVKIPAGIQNRDKIRIIGRGKSGKNGGKNGDLFIIVNIKNDNKMKIVGSDLFVEIPIKPWEAALGTKKNIKVLDDDVSILIPQCVNSGDNLTIKQKGYKNGKGTRGDLHILIKIVLPEKLNKEQVIIYERLKKVDK